MPATYAQRWLALALLTATQFIIVLDVAIVNVALPSIQVGPRLLARRTCSGSRARTPSPSAASSCSAAARPTCSGVDASS